MSTLPSNDEISLYRTAYSPFDKCFVQIVKVRFDEDGEPIIDAILADGDTEMMFRVFELTKYCL
jgi:hypothetical protein|tara:strand:+ start:905 stop:1096 length:192 start_codon:yes stop_codon:yes gene_type:complete